MNTESFKVVIPHTEGASQYFGKGTAWCTAGDTHCAFRNYDKDGPLYIIILKGDANGKYQLHKHTMQFMNSSDEPVSIVEFFMPRPELTQLLFGSIDKMFCEIITNILAHTENEFEDGDTITHLIENYHDKFSVNVWSALLFNGKNPDTHEDVISQINKDQIELVIQLIPAKYSRLVESYLNVLGRECEDDNGLPASRYKLLGMAAITTFYRRDFPAELRDYADEISDKFDEIY